MLAVQDYVNENCYGKKQKNILESLSPQIAKVIDSKCIVSTLRQDKERYKTYIEDNPIGQFIADVEGIVIDCNRAFLQLLGYNIHRDVLNRRINILGNPKTKQNSLLKQLRKTSILHNHPVKLMDSSGRAVSAAGNFFAVHDRKGAMICIKGTLISEKTKKAKIYKH